MKEMKIIRHDPKAIYSVNFVWNGERYIKDVLAFDFGVSHPNCLTLFYPTGGVIIIDYIGLESIEITPLKD